LKTIGRIASIGIIAALILSSALATWMKIEDERALADQTVPWIIYFGGLLITALVALVAVIVVWLCARLVLRRRGNGRTHA
jgi:hypothetical protein